MNTATPNIEQEHRVRYAAWLGHFQGQPLDLSTPKIGLDATHAAYCFSNHNLCIFKTGPEDKMREFAANENRHLRHEKPWGMGNYMTTQPGLAVANYSNLAGVAQRPPQVHVLPIVWSHRAASYLVQYQGKTINSYRTESLAQMNRWLLATGHYLEKSANGGFNKYPEEELTIAKQWNGQTPQGYYQTQPEPLEHYWTWPTFLQKLSEYSRGYDGQHYQNILAMVCERMPENA